MQKNEKRKNNEILPWTKPKHYWLAKLITTFYEIKKENEKEKL